MLKKLAGKLKFTSNKKFSLSHTTDIHSHLIPGVDDGSKSLEQSIDILRNMSSLGFKKVITTPHIMSHRFPNSKENILLDYAKVQRELVKQNIDIDLQVAAEYYYDEHFIELIENEELMTFGDNYVLFELSYTVKPFILDQTVYKLQEAGYKPVIAHPERYTYYSTQSHYSALKEMGLYFQINAISTQNFYGKKAKQAVEKIISLGMVDFIGSDIHSQKYFDSFSLALRSKLYKKLMKNNPIKNDFL